jgi:hypothetical protein
MLAFAQGAGSRRPQIDLRLAGRFRHDRHLSHGSTLPTPCSGSPGVRYGARPPREGERSIGLPAGERALALSHSKGIGRWGLRGDVRAPLRRVYSTGIVRSIHLDQRTKEKEMHGKENGPSLGHVRRRDSRW